MRTQSVDPDPRPETGGASGAAAARAARPLATFAGVLLATTVGAALRWPGLTDWDITHWDETLTWNGARWFASRGAEGHYSPTHAPPLVSAMLALPAMLGGGPGLALLLNLAVATLSIPLAFFAGRELATPRAGVCAAFLLALTPLHVLYARSLLTETTYVALLLAALGFSARHLRLGTLRSLLAASLCVILLQYTKYNGCLAGAGLMVVMFFQTVRGGGWKSFFVRSILFMGPVALAMGLNIAAIAAMGDWSAFVDHYAGYVGDDVATPRDVLGILRLVSPVALTAAGLAGAFSLLTPLRARGALLLLTSAVYVAFLFRYSFFLRLFAPVAALLALCGGLFLDRMSSARPAWIGKLVFVAILALAFVDRGPWERTRHDSFDGYRRAAEAIGAVPGAPPVLLVGQKGVWPAAAGGTWVSSPNSAEARSFLGEHEEILLVLDVGAFSRLRKWDMTPLMPQLETWRVGHVDNTVHPDVLQNNLTTAELRRIELDSQLAQRVSSIHLFRLPTAELESLIDEGVRLWNTHP